MVPQSGGVYVNEGLPPVSLKHAKKLLSGDYVEMEGLLPEVSTLEDDPSELKCRCSRQVLDIYLAAVLWSMHQHLRGAIAGCNPQAHGLHDDNNHSA